MTQKFSKSSPLVLCILDGWGIAEDSPDNAISNANTEYFDHLLKTHPNTSLNASDIYVGLPNGQMGNSEVGHMTIGSGRIVMQELSLINYHIDNKTLKDQQQLQQFISQLKASGGKCHLLGLASDGGIHSHINHMIELIKIITPHSIEVCLHLFLDGRDTPPCSALSYVKKIEQVARNKMVTIATISGRYYSMDRDFRWERTKKAYEAIALGGGKKFNSTTKLIESCYKDSISDEFIPPSSFEKYNGICSGDGLLVTNFRSDRIRQILKSILDPEFCGFDRSHFIKIPALGMVHYSRALAPYISSIFVSARSKNTLGEALSNHHLTQLRIAETEKYPHVTYFFNSGCEDIFDGEERTLIQSSKVATYDLKPEMSAIEITDHLIEEINKNKFDVIIVNYANADMVGHTGNFEATKRAIETIDKCLSRITTAILEKNGSIIITSDHGNAEKMYDHHTLQSHTAHTLNPVPFVLVGNHYSQMKLKSGNLSDIAPTMLELLNIQKPTEMTGNSLITAHTHSALLRG